MKIGLCEGGTYTAKSPNMAADRCINLFPEALETPNPKNKFGLMNTPGLRKRWELEDGPVRALFTIPFSAPSTERVFAVSGSTFYELIQPADWSDESALGTSIDYGDVLSDGFPAFLAFNGTQLAIASTQHLFIFDTTANTLSAAVVDSSGDTLNPICVVYLDGYFLINIPGTQHIRFSALLDGTQWDPLDVFDAEIDPDRALILNVDHGILWAFGDATCQPFTDTGDADNPFEPYKAGTIQQGLGAPASVASLDNGQFFLGKDPKRGGLVAWRVDGTSLQRVSNHGIEQFWESYARTDDAVSDVFIMQGHPFWQITFPTANKTWRYDVATEWWHEVGCWNTRTAEFEAHHSIHHTTGFGGRHLVGDRGGECCRTQTSDLAIATTCPITQATFDQAYTFTFAATGGATPYTWTLISGAIPGLSLDPATGVLSGTPTIVGTQSFVVQVQDNNGTVVQKSCSIVVSSSQNFFTGSVPLIMMNSQIFWSDVRRWTATDMYIDPANYQKQDGVSCAIAAAWFEADILDTGPGSGLGPDTLELIDETDTVVATITTDGIPGEGGKRYRVAANISTTTPHTYRLRTGGINFYLECVEAMIILDVQDAYKVKLMAGFLVAGSDSTATGGGRSTEALDNIDLWALAYSTTSYSVEGDQNNDYPDVGKCLKDEAKFASIDHWEFEVLASQFAFLGEGGEASSNGYAALFNATSGLQVTGSELAFPPGTSRQTVKLANNAVNFTDLNDFEPRFKVANGAESLGVVRCILYVVLTSATKALYVAGRVINDNEIPYVTPVLNTESGRYYHDASKYAAGTKFYYEMTGQQKGTDNPVAQMNDANDADWGYQSADGVPSTATVISGSWTNKDNAADDGTTGGPLANTSALFESIVSGAIGQLQLGGFAFAPAIPGGATIQLVNFLLHYNLEGQTAPFAVSVNGQAFHSANGTVFTAAIESLLYDATNDKAWTPADFAAPTIDIKCTHPANTTDTKWWINGGILIVGWSDLLAPSLLHLTATHRVRYRSGQLTLTDTHRYTALHPNSDTGSNKIRHSSGLILAEVAL